MSIDLHQAFSHRKGRWCATTVYIPARDAWYAFNPASQVVVVNSVNIVGVNFSPVSTGTPASGFTASFISQNEAGLNVYISVGQFMGVNVPGQVIGAPPNAQPYIWADGSGNLLTGASVPEGAYGICLVIAGQLQTSGSGPNAPGGYVTSNAILSITDIRIN
ncbi:MAG TPA: hypothetical protein VNO32_39720 [Candidatus Acidoferrum sp.]|nr:hypothetical protein [Candidatus Acidoferrum sp.]